MAASCARVLVLNLALAAAAGAIITGCSTTAAPPEPQASAPASGGAEALISRTRVGQATVTTLLDGRAPFPLGLFSGVETAEAERLLRAGGEAIEGPQGVMWHATVQGFLVEVGGKRALIDTGAGGMMPGTGSLRIALGTARIAPEAIDAVLISHFHGDHIGGLLGENGEARFANATLHVHADEAAYWTSAANAASAPEQMKPMFQMAQRVTAAYGDRVRTFGATTEIMPGLTAEPAVGHTPGHTVFRLSSGGRQAYFIGDMIHARTLQLPRPEVTLQFDVNADQARAARAGFLARVAGTGALVAGPHFPFPGVGRVDRAGQGYRFTATPAS